MEANKKLVQLQKKKKLKDQASVEPQANRLNLYFYLLRCYDK